MKLTEEQKQSYLDNCPDSNYEQFLNDDWFIYYYLKEKEYPYSYILTKGNGLFELDRLSERGVKDFLGIEPDEVEELKVGISI